MNTKMKKVMMLLPLAAGLTYGLGALAQSFTSHTCVPTAVGVGEAGTANERVVITCSQPGANGSGSNTIRFFALPTSGTGAAERSQRFLAVGTSALVSGRRVVINYTHTVTTPGCGATNCRTPLDFTLQ